MKPNDHIPNELNDLQSELPFANSNPLSAPEGYFEGFAASMLAKVKGSDDVQSELTELSPLLAGMSKANPFGVPQGYFEAMAADALVVAQDADPASPLLQSINKEMPYSLPQGYFEGLPVTILAQVTQPQAKVVPLFARTWMRIAAAAVVAGAVLVAGLQLLNKKDDTVVAPGAATNVTATVQPKLQQELKQASTKEIEEFVEAVQVPAEGKTKPAASGQSTDLLKDVSATEMERFLSSMPSLEEEGLLTD